MGLVLQLWRQSFFIGLGWGGASEGRMRPRGVIEVEPLGNGALGGNVGPGGCAPKRSSLPSWARSDVRHFDRLFLRISVVYQF